MVTFQREQYFNNNHQKYLKGLRFLSYHEVICIDGNFVALIKMQIGKIQENNRFPSQNVLGFVGKRFNLLKNSCKTKLERFLKKKLIHLIQSSDEIESLEIQTRNLLHKIIQTFIQGI